MDSSSSSSSSFGSGTSSCKSSSNEGESSETLPSSSSSSSWITKSQLKKEQISSPAQKSKSPVPPNKSVSEHPAPQRKEKEKDTQPNGLNTPRPLNLSYLQSRIAEIKLSMTETLGDTKLLKDQSFKKRLDKTLSNFDTKCEESVKGMQKLLRKKRSQKTIKKYLDDAIHKLENHSKAIKSAYLLTVGAR